MGSSLFKPTLVTIWALRILNVINHSATLPGMHLPLCCSAAKTWWCIVIFRVTTVMFCGSCSGSAQKSNAPCIYKDCLKLPFQKLSLTTALFSWHDLLHRTLTSMRKAFTVPFLDVRLRINKASQVHSFPQGEHSGQIPLFDGLYEAIPKCKEPKDQGNEQAVKVS